MKKETKEIILEIKKILLFDYYGEDDINESYLGDIELAWKDFIDNQEMGDCQYICNSLKNINGVQLVFGEIEVDYPSYEESEEYDLDEDDYVETEKENYFFTHHWVLINNYIFEFSKGTLKDNIDWVDLYSVDPEITEKYNTLY